MTLKIFRISNVFSWSLAVLCGSLLFWTSQSVQRAEDDLRHAKKMVGLELEAIRVLEAEWDYLNSPYRLDAIVQSHFEDAQTIKPNIISSPSHIPSPQADSMDNEAELIHVSVKPARKPATPRPSARTQASLPQNIIKNENRRSFDKLLQDLDVKGDL